MSPQSFPVYGYHGTSRSNADLILAHGFQLSRNDYDWLGAGIYFFQDAPLRALQWATAQFPEEPAVLRSILILRDCLDLVDVGFVEVLRGSYSLFQEQCQRSGRPLPRQTRMAHRLDCAVIDFAAEVLESTGRSVSAVRGIFQEGEAYYPESALTVQGHIQIAVRDLTCIQETVIIDVG